MERLSANTCLQRCTQMYKDGHTAISNLNERHGVSETAILHPGICTRILGRYETGPSGFAFEFHNSLSGMCKQSLPSPTASSTCHTRKARRWGPPAGTEAEAGFEISPKMDITPYHGNIKKKCGKFNLSTQK